ncbi:unnamed protein product [Knipowitschia caucasica]
MPLSREITPDLSSSGFKVTCVPPIKVDLHSHATFRCCVNPPQNLTSEFVKWSVEVKTGEKIVYLRDMGVDYQDQHLDYKGRTEIVEEDLERGNISLIIHNVTEADTAVYHLTVKIEDQTQNQTQTQQSNVTLTVITKGHDMGQGDKDHKGPDVLEPWEKALIGIGIVIVIGIGAVCWFVKRRRSIPPQVPNHELEPLNRDQQATNQEEEPLDQDQQATNQEEEPLDQDQQATNQEEEPLNRDQQATNQEEEPLDQDQQVTN